MPYLALDLELTGTDPGWHEIIQIGAALYDDNWNEMSRFLSNVYPENEESFSRPAEEVHNLSWDELQDAPMLNEVLEDFEDWVTDTLRLRNDPDKWRHFRQIVIAGQSVMYDVNFLKFAYRDENMKWPFSNNILDLHILTFFLFPILARHGIHVPKKRSLGAISEYFGFERESDTHNALEDAILSALCLKEVMKYQELLSLEK